MPIHSTYPPIDIPAKDLWDFIFDHTDREFSKEHHVYVDIAANKSVTFGEIQTTAKQFGQALLGCWAWRKGDVLALITPNYANIASVMFGTLFAGGVVCPLNYLSTASDLAQSLKASSAKAIVTSTSCLEIAKAAAEIAGMSKDKIVLIDGTEVQSDFRHFSQLQSSIEETPRPQINPEEDLAFLVYSSGTTGLPKGVMLTHRNIVANMIQNATVSKSFVDWTSDRSLGFLPMYHIYGISALIFSPLYQGVQTYIMQRFDLQDFCRVVQDNKITIAYIVPPVASALAKSPIVDKYNLTSLRILTSAAAPAPRDVLQEIHRRFGIPTRQVYGLSEASPGVASQTLDGWNKPIGSTGHLAPNMSLKIMHNGKEMRCDEEGELCIRGPNIFKGYYKNIEATAATMDAEGWYRTGDIGYFDENNNIFITDRLKELIKYNGFQVPPAQLEALLIGHPAVLDVAVVGVYSEEKATELPRAYIVLVHGHQADVKMERNLHEWFNEQVVPYKRLRGGIRFVQSIPKSAAGKILRRVLVEQAKKEHATALSKARL